MNNKNFYKSCMFQEKLLVAQWYVLSLAKSLLVISDSEWYSAQVNSSHQAKINGL